MSGTRLSPLRPLVPGAVTLLREGDQGAEATPEHRPLPWEASAERSGIESELKEFCRSGELVYAAVVSAAGEVISAICTVGARPHNEAQIGQLVRQVLSAVAALGEEVGEGEPDGLSFRGARWSYLLEPLNGECLLFGIHSSQALPAIIRAASKKSCPIIVDALKGGEKPEKP